MKARLYQTPASLLFFILFPFRVASISHESCSISNNTNMSVSFKVGCKCGKVQAAIKPLDTAGPSRLVCYCRDCRGYFETLNQLGSSKGLPPAASLDAWGGVDWTVIYPRDIQIEKGKDLLTTRIIRPKSNPKQVYSTCCYTPMFRFGAMSVLLNSELVPADEKPTVQYRIIGRKAWEKTKDEPREGNQPRPNMSWSVPFSFFWTMGKRIKADLMEPMPLVLPEDVEVLEDFKEG